MLVLFYLKWSETQVYREKEKYFIQQMPRKTQNHPLILRT